MMQSSNTHKPVSEGNRQDGLVQDFVNENIELVRKLSFAATLGSDDYGGNLQLLDEVDSLILHLERELRFC